MVDALEDCCDKNVAVLVDCLTLWIANLMGSEKDVEEEIDRLISILPNLEGEKGILKEWFSERNLL